MKNEIEVLKKNNQEIEVLKKQNQENKHTITILNLKLKHASEVKQAMTESKLLTFIKIEIC